MRQQILPRAEFVGGARSPLLNRHGRFEYLRLGNGSLPIRLIPVRTERLFQPPPSIPFSRHFFTTSYTAKRPQLLHRLGRQPSRSGERAALFTSYSFQETAGFVVGSDALGRASGSFAPPQAPGNVDFTSTSTFYSTGQQRPCTVSDFS